MTGFLLWHGLAEATRQNYETPRRSFFLFSALKGYRHRGGECLPAKAVWLIEWIASLAGRVKVKTMKVYLSGLRSCHVDLGLPIVAFQDDRLERVIRGIKRQFGEANRRERTPLTRDALVLILRCLQEPTYENITLRAAFTLAFAGFLRVGEFTYRAKDLDLGHNFRSWFLTKSSVTISTDRSHMSVNLPASKTDPFRGGVEILIAATRDEACPVKAMRRLRRWDHLRPSSAPLFTAHAALRSPFTREWVVERLRSLAATAGLGTGAWNGHSFRRGAATWAAERGLPEDSIQALGRWSSTAYRAYIETSYDARIALSRRFQRP